MARLLCPRCNQWVDAIKVFERSPKTKKGWLITRCPKERCGYNLDIEAHVTRAANDTNGGRFFWKDYGFW